MKGLELRGAPDEDTSIGEHSPDLSKVEERIWDVLQNLARVHHVERPIREGHSHAVVRYKCRVRPASRARLLQIADVQPDPFDVGIMSPEEID